MIIMTQIQIFSETTYSSKNAGPDALTIDGLQKKVNEFLAEKGEEIRIKDIQFSVQSPNPNNSAKVWTIMVIYETK